MYAIIYTGGKQYKVEEGDVLFVERLDAEADDTVKFDKVLAVSTADSVNFGAPYVDGACVTAKVVKNGKNKKVRIIKHKAKKGYRKRQGHRQPYTQVSIENISF